MYFPLIDVLRGFAALSVVVYHVIEHFHWLEFPSSGPLVWFRIGWLGVDLFFVISGFVVPLSAFSLIDKYGHGAFRAHYLKRRFLRIAPLYYLTCLLFVAVVTPQLALTAGFWANVISHGVFLHNLFPQLAGAMDGVNWSVGVEMQFYLLVLVLAPWMRNCRWWLIPVLAFPMAWAWRFAVFHWVPIDPQLGPYYRFWGASQLPGSLDEFAAGTLLARFFRSPRTQGLRAAAERFSWLVVVVAALLVWLSLATYWPRASFWDSMRMVVLWRTLCGVACAAVVMSTCCIKGTLVMTATWPLRFLGTISYGVYLWHLLIILSFRRMDWLSGGQALPYVLTLTLLLAAGSWFFFERAFLLRVGTHLAARTEIVADRRRWNITDGVKGVLTAARARRLWDIGQLLGLRKRLPGKLS